MGLLRPRVRDDRGRRQAVRTGWLMPGWARSALPVGNRCIGVLSLLVPFSVVIGALTGITVAIQDATGPWRVSSELEIIVYPLAIAFAFAIPSLAIAIVVNRHAYWARKGKRWLLYRRTCVSCWYRLDRLAPEPDGCTVCPECGAAWRVEGTQARSHAGTEGKNG